MKVAGIIAEYNPFHKGHAYHIEETKRRTGCDHVIALMSGDFVQRGAPAIMDKYSRTKMALESGVDLVLELPVCYATASAELFAAGGIAILSALGCVEHIGFGYEDSGQSTHNVLNDLEQIADILAEEPALYADALSAHLKSGLSYPAARAKAMAEYTGHPVPALDTPNNILAVEYLKAIRRQNSSLKPAAIPRQGEGYHSLKTDGIYASATAIREYLKSCGFYTDAAFAKNSFLKHDNEHPILRSSMTDYGYHMLMHEYNPYHLLSEQDFSGLLHYQLLQQRKCLNHFADGNPELNNRIVNELEHYTDWSDFCTRIKSKNQTYTAISRFLLHVLLNYTKEHAALAREQLAHPSYVRILGMRKSAGALLKQISLTGTIPVITRLAEGHRNLSDTRLLDLDIHASDICRCALTQMDGCERQGEFRQSLIYK